MKAAEYRTVHPPKLKRDWKGKMIRTRDVIRNGWGEIPKGSVGVISYQGPKGSNITFNACPCCRLKATVSQVSQEKLEFIEPLEIENAL